MKFFYHTLATVGFTCSLLLQLPSAKAEPVWKSAFPLPHPTQEMYADVWNERIYTLGGLSNKAQIVLDSFLEYDPIAGSWKKLANLPEARHHISISVVDDELYGIGGFTGPFPHWQAQDTIFIYDFNSKSWTKGPSLPKPLGEQASVVIDNKIFVIGGRYRQAKNASQFSEHIDTSNLSIFDTKTKKWSSGPDAPTARNSHAAVAIDNKIFVVGGRQYVQLEDGTRANVNVAILEVYNPQTQHWQALSPMPKATGGISAATHGGKLYVFGGEQWAPDKKVFRETWVYDVKHDQWSSGPDMITPRHGTAAAAVGNAIYVFGGADKTGASAVSKNEVLLLE